MHFVRFRRLIALLTTLPAALLGADVFLGNEQLRVVFDPGSGSISALLNKLTGESLVLREEGFRLDAVEFSITPAEARLQALRKVSPEQVEAVYTAGGRTVTCTYILGRGHNYLEKTLAVLSPSAFGWKNVVVSRVNLEHAKLELIRYPHQKMVTWFGRSGKSGIFLGIEKPFDNSSVENATVALGYAPSLKVNANQTIGTEPVYLGVYRRAPEDQPRPNLPLESESEAMVAMTSAILGPPRQGFVPMACGWWSEMEHDSYRDEAAVQADMRSLDFLREAGVDWFSDSHPWGGETDRMNALREGDGYTPGPLASKFYEYARTHGLKTVFWPTMNNTHPWWPGKGHAFLLSRGDWLMYPEKRTISGAMLSGIKITESVQGNCIANRPFRDWINRLSLDGMRTGYFPGWVMDGDFFGGGGVVTPVDCPRTDHDHLANDSTYACERALTQLIENVRKSYQGTYIFVCRPPEDLGVFYQKNVDAVFTIDEMAKPEALPGLHNQPINVMLGDKVRKWSRVRVHHHFFPHYIDQPQVFVGPKSMGKLGQEWPSEAIDYVILSAISSSPNQLYYLPTKAGIPGADKQTIRRWMDWGRKNAPYLLVRKDLPDWPQAGKVDGSAHILGDRGYVFLFNPNPMLLDGRFALTESLGFTKGSRYHVSSAYPESPVRRVLARGQTVTWKVPAQSAVVLQIGPE